MPTRVGGRSKVTERAPSPVGTVCRGRVERWRSALGLVAASLVTVLAPATAGADVFKYVDQQGNVYFSDEPLTRAGLKLEWKRTATRLAAQNREQSESIQRQQREVKARLEARSKAEVAAAALYQQRPAKPVSGSMWVRRTRYQPLIESAARRHGLVPELLHAVIRTESAYKSNALSHAGACGLMQLMPGTAKRFRVSDIWDPAQNIEGGATYLRFLLDLFDNDLRLALAGYNAGEGAVKRYGNQIPPFPETQNYVRKVLQFLLAEEAHRQS
ncbi:MAG: lytic transglycosylase domain-containing protein [Lamprobacter sp.]|uniref:lytic transglycosylase domain-containing protein n=1 Tax=Lamprobacter sp. TaxID=3100796 RepID=UPI002B263018|nr:lytic transglycosylase domain-containing protein [Lamprobacter sp.]MEA3640428.1 lytic transglycosylase domain-containing protein [Lamprobacter sp.]